MSAVLISNPLPTEIVALSAETSAQLDALILAGDAIKRVSSEGEYLAADAVLAEIVKVSKAIEAERKRIKAPILDLGRALDDAAGEALAPLASIKSELGRKVLAYQTAENARRAEEARKVAAERAAAEAKAREEQAELNRIRREAEAARLATEMAQESAHESGVELAPWDLPEPLPEVPEAVVIVPEYIAPAPVALKSSSVVMKTVKKLEIIDESAIPAEVAGVRLWVRDDAAITKLLKAGVPVPGCQLVDVSSVAAKG